VNREIRRHVLAYADFIQNDVVLNEATRGDDTEHVGRVLASARAILLTLVNPSLPVAESAEGVQNPQGEDGDSEPETTDSPPGIAQFNE
jgi:hypothetical protein